MINLISLGFSLGVAFTLFLDGVADNNTKSFKYAAVVLLLGAINIPFIIWQ